MPFNSFYSKILLFGEYSILFDSNGLTIPYSHFNGSLSYINKDGYTDLNYAKRSNTQLQEYADFIEKNITGIIQIDQFKSDLKKGLYFESSIPEGYGIGSSGALVASIYSIYGINNIQAKAGLPIKDIQYLKSIFATLESYFHGKSSGIDPLICYLKHPLFIQDQKNIISIGISRKNIKSDDAIFIVDTKQVAKTAPLVDLFMQKCLNSDYLALIKSELIPITNQCIESLLSGNLNHFYANLKKLSKFQLQYFKEMIPDKFIKPWEVGIKKGDYFFKLCGSGGGGYLLGFTRTFKNVKNDLSNQGLEVIPVYQEF